MEKAKVRFADMKDLGAITDIYNEAIAKTTATFDTQPKSTADQTDWMQKHGPKLPVFVCELNGAIVGWASLSAWSDRCAYSDTVENSVYVFEKYQGRGVGNELMKALLSAAAENGIHTIIARISDGNESSIKLHVRHGFERIGVMREVGKKFGRLIDVHFMQLIIQRGSSGQ